MTGDVRRLVPRKLGPVPEEELRALLAELESASRALRAELVRRANVSAWEEATGKVFKGMDPKPGSQKKGKA